jgi:single-stranded DNA-specific DHH superfamily exonuclease
MRDVMVIELTEPKFIVGNEQRFSDFISKLNRGERVALVTHIDLDGMACAKVVNLALDVDFVKFVGYDGLNKGLIKELKAEKVRKIILTDLSIDNEEFINELEKFADILIIDHHTFQKDMNSTNTVFLNANGFAASYLCYYLFSKIKNLEQFDWLIVCAALSDWECFLNSRWMGQVYRKYEENYVPAEANLKTGRFWEMQSTLSLFLIYYLDNLTIAYDFIKDIGSVVELGKYSKIVQKEIEKCIVGFEDEKEVYGDIYFWIIRSKFVVKGQVLNEVSFRIKDKTLIIARREGAIYQMSARRQDGKVDLPSFLRNVVQGFKGALAGGHLKAAGCNISVKDIDEFRERLKKAGKK